MLQTITMKISFPVILFLAASTSAMRVSQREANDALQCTYTGLDKLDNGDDGNRASCEMLECLQAYARTYHRRGIFAKASSALNLICAGEVLIGGFFVSGILLSLCLKKLRTDSGIRVHKKPRHTCHSVWVAWVPI